MGIFERRSPRASSAATYGSAIFVAAMVLVGAEGQAQAGDLLPPPDGQSPTWLSSRPYTFEITGFMGKTSRRVQTSQQGVSYGSTLVHGIFLRLKLHENLRVGARYQLGFHQPNYRSGALGSNVTTFESGTVRFTSLSSTLHPTWNVRARLHLWLTGGLGWTHMQLPAIGLAPPSGPTLKQRTGVSLFVPMGLGIGYDITSFLSISYDGIYGLNYGQSGDLYSSQSYVDETGALAEAGPFPHLRDSFSHLLSLAWVL